MLDSYHPRELEQEDTRRAADCMQTARGDLGVALKSEIKRLAGGAPADRESARKHELACLRMASDCMELVGVIQDPAVQRRFLELARQLTAAAEPAPTPALATSI